MRQLKISKQVTNRDTLSIDKYLYEIGKYELISIEEEIDLAKKIKSNDRAALDKLVKANLRFVVSVAKQYQNQGLTLPDLINDGNLGLIKAAQRFDETRGFKFISYAVWWIRQSILQALAEQARIVRLPLNRIGSISKITKTFSRLEQEFEREPSPYEIAYELDIAPNDVKQALLSVGKHISMDAPLVDGEENNFYDVLKNSESYKPDKSLVFESLQQEISRALFTLTNKEREILKHYFGLEGIYPHTLDEIGEKFELTRERVRQIKEKAIKRLRHSSRNKMLQQFLGWRFLNHCYSIFSIKSITNSVNFFIANGIFQLVLFRGST